MSNRICYTFAEQKGSFDRSRRARARPARAAGRLHRRERHLVGLPDITNYY